MNEIDLIKNTNLIFPLQQCEKPGCNHAVYKLCFPDMERMPSWDKYPNKAFQEKDKDGKIIKSSNKRADFNAIVEYILLAYDKKSPLIAKFQSFEKRRDVALSESKMPKDLLNHDEITAMIVDFLMYQNDKLWTLIVTNENIFIEYIHVLNTKTSDLSDKDVAQTLTNREKIREYLGKITTDLELLYEKFYNGDRDLQEVVEKKRVRFTPEGIANR